MHCPSSSLQALGKVIETYAWQHKRLIIHTLTSWLILLPDAPGGRAMQVGAWFSLQLRVYRTYLALQFFSPSNFLSRSVSVRRQIWRGQAVWR